VFIRGYKETIKYFFVHQGQKIFKIVIFLLAQTQTEKVIISDEHCGFAWLPYDEAVKTVTFENSKQLLKKADVFVKKIKKVKIKTQSARYKIKTKITKLKVQDYFAT